MPDQYFILEGQETREVGAEEWLEWYENAGDLRLLARSFVGEVMISTVFIGIAPTVFQTYVWGGRMDGASHNSLTWAGAELAHNIMTNRVYAAEARPDGEH